MVDAMTGQDAVTVAKTFNDELGVDGVILTKLDGDTRGGAAISVRAVTGKPIKFSGVGEKLTDLEPFHPDRMASRILGMGDVLSLIEKAQDTFDEKEAGKLVAKVRTNSFTLEDYLDQIRQLGKMGSITDVLKMIPGVGSKLNASRKRRIAAGSGATVQEVNLLLKQFEQARDMMKSVMGGGKRKMRIPFGRMPR